VNIELEPAPVTRLSGSRRADVEITIPRSARRTGKRNLMGNFRPMRHCCYVALTNAVAARAPAEVAGCLSAVMFLEWPIYPAARRIGDPMDDSNLQSTVENDRP